MRLYVYAGIIAALLYPLTWCLFIGIEATRFLFSDLTLSLILLGMSATSAIAALLAMRFLARNMQPPHRRFVVRYLGAVAAGLLSGLSLNLLLWAAGDQSAAKATFAGILMISTPGLLAAWGAYWAVGFLVRPVDSTLPAGTLVRK